MISKLSGFKVNIVAALMLTACFVSGCTVKAVPKKAVPKVYSSEANRLIAEGAGDINATDEDGETALMRASSVGDKAVVELLVVKGADVNAKTKADRTHRGMTALEKAFMFGKREIAEFLIANGADYNDKDYVGNCFLCWASGIGSKAIVEFLLAKGANVNAQSALNKTYPLMMASRNGHKEIVELLLAKGANVNAKKLGHTQYYVHRHPMAGQIGDPFPIYSGDETALSLATEKGHKAIVELLVKAGAK